MTAWRALLFEFSAMASPCSIRIETRDEHAATKAAQAAISEVQRIEMKYSRYLSTSVISKINDTAGGSPVAVDEETATLLNFADQLWRLSDGLFDATSGGLRKVWNFKQAVLPNRAQLAQALTRIGWAEVHHSAAKCRLAHAGMELDFGGFGKEYATDRAAGILQQYGVEHALVNLGGDIHALGCHGLPELAGQAWKVEVQHPRRGQASLAGIDLYGGGMATSGDYERFFELDGKRYCHVLDPRTGWPVTYWQSISVLAPNTTMAGALTTITMLKGAQGLAWLEEQDVSYMAVRHDGVVHENMSNRVAASTY
ncbi:MAG: FAD:protein FMN transferase [Burkholderiaceae bacterium]